MKSLFVQLVAIVIINNSKHTILVTLSDKHGVGEKQLSTVYKLKNFLLNWVQTRNLTCRYSGKPRDVIMLPFWVLRSS